MRIEALYILGTIAGTVYGQVILKWRISTSADYPTAFGDKIFYVLRLLLDPYVASAFAAAFLAGLSWMFALEKVQLSVAYPFMSASFLLVTLASVLLFHEHLTIQKVVGLCLIMLGIIVHSQSS